MKNKNIIFFLSIIAISLLFTNCKSNDISKQTRYTIAVYAFASRDVESQALRRDLRDPSGKPITIEKLPIISSRNIVSIEKLTNSKGNITLKLYLERSSSYKLMQLCNTYQKQKLAIIVDGTYICETYVQLANKNYQTCYLIANWNPKLVESLILHAPRNYAVLNKR